VSAHSDPVLRAASLSGLQLDRLQESLRVPRVLGGRYQILRALGRGGMGVVYLAEDSRLQRKVAVKVIDPGVASAELEARLEREARLLGRLAHPGIVPIYDLGRQDDLTLFYVMKYVDGETLERWLPAHPSRAERLRLFQKLCDPVSFAHAQGVVHRDLKPANVMIGAFGEVLIMDWGLARPIDEPHDADDVGTPGYRAPVIIQAVPAQDGGQQGRGGAATAAGTKGPVSNAGTTELVSNAGTTELMSNAGTTELVSNADTTELVSNADTTELVSNAGTTELASNAGARAEVSARAPITADVFSLGGILFFLLTGQHPPAGAEPVRPRSLDATVDPRLDAVCARATHPEPAERYGSVRELEAEVLRYLDGEAVHAYRERWHEKAGRWVRRHQLVLSLILMYLLMRVIVALVR
jgi:eukaryotic-like serine/threonine-protein kinase